jgi:hypothetical protein
MLLPSNFPVGAIMGGIYTVIILTSVMALAEPTISDNRKKNQISGMSRLLLASATVSGPYEIVVTSTKLFSPMGNGTMAPSIFDIKADSGGFGGAASGG